MGAGLGAALEAFGARACVCESPRLLHLEPRHLDAGADCRLQTFTVPAHTLKRYEYPPGVVPR